ncbi:MAG: MFS transporter [Pseudomonadota bacterium]
MRIVHLAEAREEAEFGAKAARLGDAIRAGLPVPHGVALAWREVEAIASGGQTEGLADLFAAVEPPLAVRSSAVGEDGVGASFAGQHATVLNVCSEGGLLAAIQRVAESARAPQALAYRERLQIDGTPRMGVVVQHLVQSDCAGVLFTIDPLSGKAERVIEAAWGLGEVVVAGLVTPDRYRLDSKGVLLEQSAGEKDVAIRSEAGGGVKEVASPAHEVHALCLNDRRLASLSELATHCEEYGDGPQDIEWAFEGETLHLLQWRPITRSPKPRDVAERGSPVEPKLDQAAPLASLGLREMLALQLSVALVPLNSTMLAAALPEIARDFSVSASLLTLSLVTSYLLVALALQTSAGKLSDGLGHARALLIGQVLFGAASLLGFAGRALPTLIAARILMAIGGALMIPSAMATIRARVSEVSRPAALGALTVAVGAATAAGPVVGGELVTRFGWGSLFLVNVPLVAAAALLRGRAEKLDRRPLPSFDVLGAVLLGASLALLALAARPGPHRFIFIGVGLLVLLGFWAWERKTSEPLLDFGLFSLRPFVAGSSLVALQNLAVYSLLFELPIVFSRVLGQGAQHAGRTLLALTLSMIVFSLLGGRLARRWGERTTAVLGCLVSLLGMAMLGFLPLAWTALALVAVGAGSGLASPSAQASAINVVPTEKSGVAVGVGTTMRYLGGVVGIAIVTALVDGGEILSRHRLGVLAFSTALVLATLCAAALPRRSRALSQ